MEVLVSLEHRFCRTPDGKVWSQTMFPYSFWRRYLEVFSQVKVVARVQEVALIPPGWRQANGPGVSFEPIPYYEGPWQFLLRSCHVRRIANQALSPENAVILRVGSTIGGFIENKCRRERRPYALEVVGDPYDVFSPGSFRHPLRPFFRWWFTRRLRRQCANAIAASYVTSHTLQRRYPCPGYTVGVSDVELHDRAFISTPRKPKPTGPLTIITVGSLNHFYKAPDVLIEAVGQCVRQGMDLKLVVVGGGKYLKELKSRAESLGLQNRHRFTGQLTCGDPVMAQLDQADIFVLPSRQEGLPRAMIEAMARGLPCIGSTVGGIPELLPPEDMVPPGDVQALAKKIKEVLTNPERMADMSARNLAKAREYSDENLRERRNSFYRYVKEKTEEWLKRRGR